MSTLQKASLLGLPLELRCKIWSFCKPNDHRKVAYLWQWDGRGKKLESMIAMFGPAEKLFNVTPLLLVNRQIYNETLQVAKRQVRLELAGYSAYLGRMS